MNYFITGATGFLGGYVTSELLEGGHAVTALVADRDEARDIAEYGVRPTSGHSPTRKRSAAVCDTPTECSTLRVIASSSESARPLRP